MGGCELCMHSNINTAVEFEIIAVHFETNTYSHVCGYKTHTCTNSYLICLYYGCNSMHTIATNNRSKNFQKPNRNMSHDVDVLSNGGKSAHALECCSNIQCNIFRIIAIHSELKHSVYSRLASQANVFVEFGLYTSLRFCAIVPTS